MAVLPGGMAAEPIFMLYVQTLYIGGRMCFPIDQRAEKWPPTNTLPWHVVSLQDCSKWQGLSIDLNFTLP